jgi:hypothetical protein
VQGGSYQPAACQRKALARANMRDILRCLRKGYKWRLLVLTARQPYHSPRVCHAQVKAVITYEVFAVRLKRWWAVLPYHNPNS